MSIHKYISKNMNKKLSKKTYLQELEYELCKFIRENCEFSNIYTIDKQNFIEEFQRVLKGKIVFATSRFSHKLVNNIIKKRFEVPKTRGYDGYYCGMRFADVKVNFDSLTRYLAGIYENLEKYDNEIHVCDLYEMYYKWILQTGIYRYTPFGKFFVRIGRYMELQDTICYLSTMKAPCNVLLNNGA